MSVCCREVAFLNNGNSGSVSYLVRGLYACLHVRLTLARIFTYKEFFI